jgi:hypothetical protein
MGAKPNDQDDLVFLVDFRDQPVVVPFDIEHHSFGRDDAGGAASTLQLGRISPTGSFRLYTP